MGFTKKMSNNKNLKSKSFLLIITISILTFSLLPNTINTSTNTDTNTNPEINPDTNINTEATHDQNQDQNQDQDQDQEKEFDPPMEIQVNRDNSQTAENQNNQGNQGNQGSQGQSQQIPQGNIIDDVGHKDLKDLGFDTKEFLTKNEMKILFQKIFLKEVMTDKGERQFYKNLIEFVITREIP